MKDFRAEQETLRNQLQPLLTMSDVRRILACSVSVVIRLIQSGDLEAFDVHGRAVDKRKIDNHTYGLRISPSSVQSYLDRVKVG